MASMRVDTVVSELRKQKEVVPTSREPLRVCKGSLPILFRRSSFAQPQNSNTFIVASLYLNPQGSLTIVYPTEAQKAFGRTFKSMYPVRRQVGFLILTLIGVVLPLFMVNPDKVNCTDRTLMGQVRNTSSKTVFFTMFVILKTAWVVLLLPMFYASNHFYIFEFNNYNGALFTIRARTANYFMYWTSQIFDSILIGYFILDPKRLRRRVCAFCSWAVMFLVAYFYQKQVNLFSYQELEFTFHAYLSTYTPAEETATHACKIDITCILADKCNVERPRQVCRVHLFLTRSILIKNYADKSLQSVCAAGVWRANAVGIPYTSILLSTWSLTVGGMIFPAPMVYLRVRDHTRLGNELPPWMHIEGVEKVEPPIAAITEKAYRRGCTIADNIINFGVVNNRKITLLLRS
ncbi:hypothetical protein K503DRAFT_784586 [Rhizopogon vinicolor AM-OR11-026]|uniref:Uncharacterized protein n=1 Tax=Rhizopogon vinicolor AM-OR11-026 TaxID=1314800 RepID=A0A1B7MU46_9AGAM|nr:hypothetical protein K503DRAFT_784586 [Rhizopogon vinicolor AM-OR11-026]